MSGHATFVKAEDCNYYRGTRYPTIVPETTFDALKTLEVRDDDVWLLTYPKAGTTWMMEIVYRILNHGNLDAKKIAGELTVYPEFHIPGHKPNWELLSEMTSPRFVASHVNGDLLPPQLQEKKAKIIYVARNPKDLAVSFFNHHKVDPMIPKFESWEQFYNAFITDDVIFGSWSEHTLYWWKRRNDDNVMFISYEEMKKDLRGNVARVAKFLERELKEGQIDEITESCTFQSMKARSQKEAPRSTMLNVFKVDKSESPFVRKGEVGSWRSQFTVTQSEQFDAVYKEWIGDSDLKLVFEMDQTK